MSTKTLRKRIALVAVSALGFGMLAAAPSSATAGDAATNASIASLTVTNPTTPSVGAAAAFTIAVKNATAIAVGTADTFAIRAKITSAPAGGLSAFTGAFVTVTGFQNGAGAVGASGANILTAQKITATLAENTTTSIGTLTFTPAVAGTYAVNFYHDANLDGIQQDNEVFQTASISVAATSGLAANQFPNSADLTASTNGTLNGVKVSSVGIETVQISGRTGVQVSFAPQYRLTRNGGASNSDAGAANNTKFATIAYSVTNPAGTAVTVVSTQGGATASASQTIAGAAAPIALGAAGATAVTQAIDPLTGFPQKGSPVFFSAATAGTYTITAFHDADANGLVSVGEAITSSTVVVAADALPSITMTTFGQSVPADAANGGVGHLVRISLRNGTLPASLGLSEVLTISGPTGTVIDTKSVRNANLKLQMDDNTAAAGGRNAAGAATADSVATLLTQANFDAAGNAYINVGNGTAGTYTLLASIAGGAAAGATGSGTFTVTDVAVAPVTRVAATTNFSTSFSNLTGVAFAGGAVARAINDGDVTKALNVAPNKALTVSVGYLVGVANATAISKTYEALFTDSYGLVTGVVGATYDMKSSLGSAATTSTTRVSFSVAMPAITSTVAGTVATIGVLQAQTDGTAVTTTFTMAVALPVATAVVVDPASTTATTYSLRAAVGSTNVFGATVVDQYKIAMVGQPMSAQVTAGSRNAQLLVTPLITDATGKVSFSVTDTSVSTLLTSDTLVFTTLTNSLAGTVTINYAATLPVATVTITGAASEDIAPARTTNLINAAIAGASGTLVTMTAVIKDANGAILPAGIPVTWSISGLPGTSAIWTDITTGYNWTTSYTNSSGAASTFVYAWSPGTVTVSATSGGKTAATGKINFINAASDARVVSATAVGNVITAKVVDRYGNVVKGVNLTATRTAGTGYFAGSASSGATGITGANGTVDFIVTGGDVTVTVETTTLNDGQTSSAAGQVNGTAVTATGIGASLAPVGVQSVSVAITGFISPTDAAIQAAADAAAEAIDAGNNANESAVAAAEAAEAATAAAEEAGERATEAANAATAAAEAATDAANEALDAANAATDAANASAEAADAATAAAQDAADAVAALSVQVTEMIDALKKQITSLTNLVIKIQKKVKA